MMRGVPGMNPKPKKAVQEIKKFSAADFFSFFMSDGDFRKRAVTDMLRNPVFIDSLHGNTDAWLAPVTASARANGFDFTDEEFIRQAQAAGVEEFVALLRQTAGALVSAPAHNVRHVWLWSGAYFGFIDGDNLWTMGGKHVAKLIYNEIYNLKGQYVGELMGQDRLIADKRKKRLKKHISRTFTMLPSRAAISSLASRPASGTKPDYEDFMI